MDALTRQIRRRQWLQIIEACSSRSKGTTTKQWCLDHDIDRRQFYYWQAKFRSEAAAGTQDSVMVPARADDGCTGITAGFVDITDALVSPDTSPVSAPHILSLVPELMIQADELKIYISSAIQQRTLETVLQAIRHA